VRATPAEHGLGLGLGLGQGLPPRYGDLSRRSAKRKTGCYNVTVSQSSNAPGAESLFSPLLETAVRLAAQGHYHQFRKRAPGDDREPGSSQPLPRDFIPYITHLMGSMCILARIGADDRVLAAALLHDYLEDVPDPDGAETIRRAVGDQVLDLVLAVTEEKRPEFDDAETWEERKRGQIERIGTMHSDAVLIKTAKSSSPSWNTPSNGYGPP